MDLGLLQIKEILVVNAASTAIEREGPACAITLDDFLRAIEASKRAKQEVGAGPLASTSIPLW